MKDDDDFIDEYEDNDDNSSKGNSLVEFYQDNKRLIWVLGGVILLIILMLIFGGGGSGSSTTEVTISSTSENINVGGSIRLDLTVNNDNNPEVLWTSSNTSVATVSQGLVRGMAIGKATITAVYKDKTGKTFSKACEISVYEGEDGVNLVSVKFPDGTIIMSPNTKYKIDYLKTPNNGMVYNISYSSTNEAVAKVVKETGEISALSIGTSTIKLQVNEGFVAEIPLNVIDKQVTPNIYLLPTSLMIKNSEYNLVVGDSKKIEFIYLPEEAALEFVEWTSSNSDVAKVDSNGNVTAVAAGDAVITLNCGSIKSSTVIHITEAKVPVTGIATTDTNVNLKVGDVHQILAVIRPSNATNQDILYSSSNTSIVAVDSVGHVTALSAGTATVKVSSKDNPQITTDVKFTVTKDSSGGNNSGGQGGSTTSVGTVKVTSNNDCIEGTYSAAQNNPKNSYPTVTLTPKGNVDTIFYCYTTGSDCTPNISYSAPFTINENGMILIKVLPHYGGRDGSIVTRYANISVSGNVTPTQNQCYCNTSGQCRYGQSGNGYTINAGLTETECNKYVSTNNNKGCFLDKSGNMIWGSYLGNRDYTYAAHILEANCKS